MPLKDIIYNLPEVRPPLQKKLSFNEKLKWTLLMLVAFFILSVIPLFGLGTNSLSQFQQLSIILGANFGSIMSLGIGPIVTASIVLQLLTGSGILKIDLSSHDGKRLFQGLQKILALFFTLFEASIYVFMGGLAPATGVSLFIAAGVSSQIFIRAFSPLTTTGQWAFGSGQPPVGAILSFFTSLANQDPTGAAVAIAGVITTIVVFVVAVYVQAMKVEIPLSFGRIRGHGIRWPLKFIYTSNIPVILIAALLANFQLWARLLEQWGKPFLGTYAGNSPATGFVLWITPPNIIGSLIQGSFSFNMLAHALFYAVVLIIGAIIFSIFWVQTSGMDARSQAKQMMSSGLTIPGFRRDERVLEKLLSRYIFPLTVMGAIAVGIIAAIADLMGALTNGTGILLAVMIIYNLYETIAQQHMMDMHPALRKMMGGS